MHKQILSELKPQNNVKHLLRVDLKLERVVKLRCG